MLAFIFSSFTAILFLKAELKETSPSMAAKLDQNSIQTDTNIKKYYFVRFFCL